MVATQTKRHFSVKGQHVSQPTSIKAVFSILKFYLCKVPTMTTPNKIQSHIKSGENDVSLNNSHLFENFNENNKKQKVDLIKQDLHQFLDFNTDHLNEINNTYSDISIDTNELFNEFTEYQLPPQNLNTKIDSNIINIQNTDSFGSSNNKMIISSQINFNNSNLPSISNVNNMLSPDLIINSHYRRTETETNTENETDKHTDSQTVWQSGCQNESNFSNNYEAISPLQLSENVTKYIPNTTQKSIDAFTEYEDPKLPPISFKVEKTNLTKKQTAKLKSLAFFLEYLANNTNNQNYSNFLRLHAIFSEFVILTER